MIYHDFGELGDFGMRVGYNADEQKAHCDRAYGDDDNLHRKCMANDNTLSAPPWTDVGRKQRGLPATGAVGRALDKVSSKDIAKATDAAKSAAMKKAGMDKAAGGTGERDFAPKAGLGIGAGIALALGAAFMFLRKR